MLDLTSLKPGLERVLSASLGGPVRVISCEPLPGRDVGGRYVETHPHLLRCALTSVRVDVPGTVIVKARPNDGRYDPALLRNERAALRFLEQRSLGGPGSTAAPRHFGADDVLDLVVMEDMGSGSSVDLFLVGDDADAATDALLSFARGIGRLHASTVGHADEYYRLRAALGPVDPAFDRASLVRYRLTESWRKLAGIAGAREWLPTPSPAVDADVAGLLGALAEPGPYLAFTNGDMGPQNTRMFDGEVRFLDFENAAFRHAALDVAMLRFPFPACACWSPLPPGLSDRLEDEYRREFAPACPEIADDVAFARAMSVGCAAWTILRSVRIPRLEALDAPQPMGFSRRGQLLAAIGTFAAAADEAGTFGALAGWFGDLAGALRARWPEVGESERVYPAYAAVGVGA